MGSRIALITEGGAKFLGIIGVILVVAVGYFIYRIAQKNKAK